MISSHRLHTMLDQLWEETLNMLELQRSAYTWSTLRHSCSKQSAWNRPLGCAQKPWQARMAATLLLQRQVDQSDWCLSVSVCVCVCVDQLTWISWTALVAKIVSLFVWFSPSFVGWCGVVWKWGVSCIEMAIPCNSNRKARINHWAQTDYKQNALPKNQTEDLTAFRSGYHSMTCLPAAGFSMTVSCIVFSFYNEESFSSTASL